VTALLAVLLSLERLFLADYEDGALELLALSPLPLELIVLAKALAHWLTTGLPLVLAAPLLALLYNMDLAGLPVLIFGVGAIDAALAGFGTKANLMFLAALFLVALVTAPLAAAAALRQALE
jgi:heme exporter protein B